MKKNDSLDIVRALATIMVVMVHVGQCFGSLNQYTSHGTYGVQLFFILSGYLIFCSLNNSKNIKIFYIKRIIRIVPIYWCVLLINYVYDLITGLFEGVPFGELISYSGICGVKYLRYFLFLQTWLPSDNWNAWNNRYALWTMSSFAFFYLIAPLLFKIMRNIKSSVILFLLSLLLRYFVIEIIGKYCNVTSYFYECIPLSQIYCFVIGGLIFRVILEKKQWHTFMIITMFLIITQMRFLEYELLFAILLITCICIECEKKKNIITVLINIISNCSFCVYLIQSLIITIYRDNVIKLEWIPKEIRLVALIFLIFFIGYAMWNMIERPIENKLKTYLIKKVDKV